MQALHNTSQAESQSLMLAYLRFQGVIHNSQGVQQGVHILPRDISGVIYPRVLSGVTYFNVFLHAGWDYLG